uniref:Uncharacterized protein n=1 Tax=Arundo donax TaxID=35708 RepID=A0A0A8Y131_ARUDO
MYPELKYVSEEVPYPQILYSIYTGRKPQCNPSHALCTIYPSSA